MIQLHSIKTKVTLGFFTCVLCFGIASGCALIALNHSSAAFKHILSESKIFSEVSEIQALFLKARLIATDYFYTHEEAFLSEFATKKANLYSSFDSLSKHEELNLNPKLKNEAITIQRDMSEYFSARAGEQGRGFAVVADEVRTLAHRTQTSTEDIEKLIEQLQSSVQQATHSIGHCRAKTLQASERAETISGTVRVVQDTVQELQEVNGQVVVAVEEQSAVTADISRNMDCANEIVIDTSQSITELAETSHHLSQLSTGLMERVRQFKLVDEAPRGKTKAA